ncbi:MAG: M48 family metallopeptidase [Fibrobacterales bacterium]
MLIILKKSFKELLLLVLLFGSIWYLFSHVELGTPSLDDLVSIELEEKLGTFIIEDLYSANPEYQKISIPPIDSVVHIISNRLYQGIDSTDYDYSISVVQSSNINAFALPGGRILVTTALISFTHSAEELAAVIAHEIGHVEHRDVVAALLKELGIAVLLSDNIASITKITLGTMHSRSQESAADQFSLSLLDKANISSKHMAHFFTRLREQEFELSEHLALLTTHPHLNSRIKAAHSFTQSDTFTEKNFDINWKRVHALTP